MIQIRSRSHVGNKKPPSSERTCVDESVRISCVMIESIFHLLVSVCVFVSVIQNFTLLLLQELVVRESSRRFCRAELCVNLLGIVFEKESKALLRLSKRDVSE